MAHHGGGDALAHPAGAGHTVAVLDASDSSARDGIVSRLLALPFTNRIGPFSHVSGTEAKSTTMLLHGPSRSDQASAGRSSTMSTTRPWSSSSSLCGAVDES